MSAETEIVTMVRCFAKEVTGGNCTFVDDDLKLLAHLAQRAVNAELVDELHPSVAEKALAARATPNTPDMEKVKP